MENSLLGSTNGAPTVIPRKNRAWIWYFVLLGVLTVAATTTLIVFNLRQQLTPQKLEAATAYWKQHAPASYDMEYTTDTAAGKSRYVVEVRNGDVVAATLDGRPLEARFYPQRSMNGLFSDIRTFMERDQKPGAPRVFVRADFDPQDGHLMRYVRSVTGGASERVQIDVIRFDADR